MQKNGHLSLRHDMAPVGQYGSHTGGKFRSSHFKYKCRSRKVLKQLINTTIGGIKWKVNDGQRGLFLVLLVFLLLTFLLFFFLFF